MMIENIKTVGIITYHYPHLKTEQVLHRILHKNYTLKIYALPFKPRPSREVLFHHRPNQMIAVAPQIIAEKYNIPYKICQEDKEIDNSCDIYLLLGRISSINAGEIITIVPTSVYKIDSL
ncbi:MAG: hypothetical protein ACK4GJ_01665 [bacterium]